MKISEVMTRDVQTIRPDQTAQEAASFMLSADAGSIPVTDGDRLIGMITDRDIAVRGVAKGNGPDTPVRDLMTTMSICARDRRRFRRSREPDERGPGPPAAGSRQSERLCGIVSLGDLSPRGDIGRRRRGARRREPARRPAPAVKA